MNACGKEYHWWILANAVSQSVFYHVLNVVSGEWCLKKMFYGEIIFI